jgi:hypothetical protein
MEISFAIIKLSQYNTNPALIHYKALRHIFAYLSNSKEDGLIVYWRPPPVMTYQICQFQHGDCFTKISYQSTTQQPPMSLLAYSDSDWGSDTTHRRSVSGTIILLAGAAVLDSTKFQKSIALSSTEAKYALCLRSILTDLSRQADELAMLKRRMRNVYVQRNRAEPSIARLLDTPRMEQHLMWGGGLCTCEIGLRYMNHWCTTVSHAPQIEQLEECDHFMVEAQAPTRRTQEYVDIRYFALPTLE